MSEIKLISPLLDKYDVGMSISEHDGVSCYPALEKDTDERYIVKKISIPASQKKLDALLLTGVYPDTASALSYFQDQADATVEELDVLRRLSEHEGFLAYADWQVCAKEDSVGFDVYMIGTYKYPLRKYLQHHPITHLAAVNFGLDICAALTACRNAGYLYIDLKPNNIYIVGDQKFKIGDLGFLPMSAIQYATLPDKYCSSYTAPEALDAFNTLSPTLDVYALGLMLYQAYNGGELPFNSTYAPEEKFPAPLYADYEMSEIILKACDPDPAERWQDPADFSHALISYMQRNGVNDTPIVPLPADVSEFEPEVADITVDEAVVEDVVQEERVEESATEDASETTSADAAEDTELEAYISEDTQTDDDLPDLSFLDEVILDETAPENTLDAVTYDEISDELSMILSQADELVSATVPEAIVAPEGISIDEIEATMDLAQGEESSEVTEQPEITEEADPTEEVIDEEPIADDEEIEGDPAIAADKKKKKRKILNWILCIIIFLLIAAISVAGLFYYKNIYLLPIDKITVGGSDNTMIVQIDTDIDETLLSVICSDSHGNQLSAPVVNGKASFANLTPDTAYTVRINVDGFHRLTGETAASYSTPAQTNIVQFSAVTGGESGSVILSFTLEGPDTGNWKVVYSAEGEPEVTADMPSHMVTLSGLTVGKEYTFRLIPGEDSYVSGTTEIQFTASDLVYAQNVAITSCVNNQLSVAWDAPADTTVSSWTVRCYNDVDYNQSTITTDTTAIFDNIDPNSNYTVEVAAAGMSVTERAFMTAGAISISNFTADVSTPNIINLSWDASAATPDGGWIVLYSVVGSDIQESVSCSQNEVQITPVVPGVSYTFKIQQANGVPVLSQPLKCDTPEAQDFSGYGMTRGTMSFQLCKRPAVADWKQSDLSDSDFTSSFAIGQEISLLGQLYGSYGVSNDEITTMFVIKDAEGNLVTYSSVTETWNAMWGSAYSTIDIPEVPDEPGVYTLIMYFNGKFVTQKEFKITA